VRALSLTAASLATAAFLAGCGGGGSTTSSTTTKAFDSAADVAYERAYTDCGSVSLADLANRYHVKGTDRDKVAIAVARYWAKQANAGAAGVEAGKEGCYDGYKAAAH
jgi:hypothetical protein